MHYKLGHEMKFAWRHEIVYYDIQINFEYNFKGEAPELP